MMNSDEVQNVMVVDDEENIRFAVERILRKVGCNVFKAADGKEALNILEKEKIEIVFLDLKMPGMDGMEVLQRIREIDEFILVIIITGYATIETAIEAMKQGAYDFIPKPFEADQLRLVARRALEKIYLTKEAARLEEERRRTLFDLATEKSRTHTIVEALPNGVLVTNSRNQIVLMNQVIKQYLGLDTYENIGKTLDECFTDEALCEFIKNIFQKQSIGNDIPTYEMELAENKILLVRGKPVLGEDEAFLGVVVIFVDISAIKRLDRLKSDFVAKVSHELRSPLSTIHEQMAFVLQDMLEQEQSLRDQKILARAQEKTRGLISLIEDLLDLSRLESGTAYQNIQAVQVEEVLSSLVDFVQGQAQEKNQTLSLHLPDSSLLPVYADPQALESIFHNLIANAIKYTPEQGEINVQVEPKQNCLQVIVEDNGFGIKEEEQERIFERFYRVKDEKTRNITGTGLGLAIVKGLLDDIGGSISVQSQPGEGSTFTVTLSVSRE